MSFDRDKAFVLIQAQLHEYEAGRGFGVDELVDALEGCVSIPSEKPNSDRLALDSIRQTVAVGGDLTFNGVLYRPFDYALGWRR